MAIKLFWETLITDVIIVILAIFLWPVFAASLAGIDAGQIANFLLMISILLVTVCFANFAFTYEKSKLQTKGGKWLSRSAAVVYMVLIALLLETMVLAIKVVYPSFYVIALIFSILLYLGCVLYDLWDAMRVPE